MLRRSLNIIQRNARTPLLIPSLLLKLLAGTPVATATPAFTDGTGTLTLSRSTASAGAARQTFTFTYMADVDGTADGTLTIDVPAGWTAPTTLPGPGLVTASAGTVTTSGQTITVSGLNLAVGDTFTITYSGVDVSPTPGLVNLVAEEQSSPGGTLTALGASPSVNVTVADGVGTLTVSPSVLSAGHGAQDLTFTYTVAGPVPYGTLTIAVDAALPAPTTAMGVGQVTVSAGTVATAGQTITVSNLNLALGSHVTITYSQAPVGTTPGLFDFLAMAKSTPAGTLTELTEWPSLDVVAADGSGTLTVAGGPFTTGQTGASLTFTYTAPADPLLGGSLHIAVPSDWSTPTSNPGNGSVTASAGTVTDAGSAIQVNDITLAGGASMSIIYSGVTVGTTTGSLSFHAQAKSAQSGTLKSLATSPSVSVAAPYWPRPEPVRVTVQPDQAAEVTTNYLTVGIPARVANDGLVIVVQQHHPTDAAVYAHQGSSVAVVAEVNAFLQSSNSAVHQLRRKVTLTFHYDPAKVQDPARLRVYYFDPVGEAWVNLGGVLDTAAYTITVAVDHFTLFAVIAPNGDQTPAEAAPQLDPLPSAEATVTYQELLIDIAGHLA